MYIYCILCWSILYDSCLNPNHHLRVYCATTSWLYIIRYISVSTIASLFYSANYFYSNKPGLTINRYGSDPRISWAHAKKGAQEVRKKGKTMHFDHSCIAFLCLLSVQGYGFYGIHNLQWRWTLKRTLEWYWGCCQEKSERLSSDIFIVFSTLPLFLRDSFFFSAHGGKMLILSEEYLEFCLPQWLCFATGVGYCPYIYMVSIVNMIYIACDFMLVCVCVCIL